MIWISFKKNSLEIKYVKLGTFHGKKREKEEKEFELKNNASKFYNEQNLIIL